MAEITIRKLRKDDKIQAITTLICRSDPILYKDLFKSQEVAEKILNILLDMKESIFYRNNYYTALFKDNMVGLSAAHDIGSSWDPTHIIEAYHGIHESLPDCFKEISQYYYGMFELSDERIILRNLSTKKGCEKRGIATKLIEKMIEDHYDKVLEFSVLVNNVEAIKLYEKLGFRIEKKVEEYGGCKKENVFCFKMIRP